MDILKIESLSKRFGQLTVIDSLSMTVQEHSVFGFIGKNGAGKTTTMKMILGFVKPDAGAISVCGERVRFGNTATNRFIGYLPDVPAFYDYMTPREYLALCGSITGLHSEQMQAKIRELLPMVGLDGVNRRVKGFSRGMKQRLGIAQALLNEPRLLICDEPTSALDPMGRREILDILKGCRGKTTIIFSTHILADVERICDTVGILNDGRVALQGALSDMKSTYRDECLQIELHSAEKLTLLCERLQAMPEVKSVHAEGNTVQVTTIDAVRTSGGVVRILADENIPLAKFETAEPDLEQVFMEVVAK